MKANGSKRPGDVERGLAATPRHVLVAGLAWLAFGVVLLVVGIDGLAQRGDSDPGGATGQLGSAVDAGPSGSGDGSVVGLIIVMVLGASIVAFAAALARRKGWARYGLEAAGSVAVITLAIDGRWQGFLAMALLAVATVPTMSASMHRYLYGEASPASTE